MSVDTSIYLGPYFRCKPRTEAVTRVIRTCPNPSCSLHGSPLRRAYCANCGTAVDPTFPVPKSARVPDPSDVREAVRNCLTHMSTFGSDNWMPDVERPDQPRDFGADAEGEIVVDPEMIEAESRWLDTAFADERATLVGLYGEGKVETRWGLLTWDSYGESDDRDIPARQA